MKIIWLLKMPGRSFFLQDPNGSILDMDVDAGVARGGAGQSDSNPPPVQTIPWLVFFCKHSAACAISKLCCAIFFGP